MDLRTDCGRRELGRRIQAAIAAAGYSSVSAFAEKMGCSRALVYQYVNGDVLAQLDRLCEIAELTNRPLDWFLAVDPDGCSGEIRLLRDRLDEALARCERLEAALAEERGARLRESEGARRALLDALLELCRAQRSARDAHGLARTAARCADLAQALGDESALMAARLHAGHAAFHLGERDAAGEALEEALEIARRVGDTRAELSARQELVRVWQASGRVAAAREQARALAENERWWPRWAGLVALAALTEQSGDLDGAEQLLAEAAAIIESDEAPADYVRLARVYVQSNRATITLARGHYIEAEHESRRLQDLAAEAGLLDQVREAHLNRAIAATRNGRFDEAAELLARLREWASLSGDRRIEALAACFEAERLARLGHAEEARRVAFEAVDIANEGLNGQALAEAEFAAGLAHLAAARADDAVWHFDRCAARAGRLTLRRLEVAARVFAALAKQMLDDPAAVDLLTQTMGEAEKLGYEDLWVEAALAMRSDDAAASADRARRRARLIGYLPMKLSEAEKRTGDS